MSKKNKSICSKIKNQHGANAVVITLSLFVLFGFAALSFDLAHIFMVKNELQNAAEAGALAGASSLYNATGEQIQTNANQIAKTVAEANKSENAAVYINYTSGTNGPEIQRGHWAFAVTDSTYPVEKSYFAANDSTTVIDITQFSTLELNANDNFINAVRVVARSQPTSVILFFARIFGIDILPMAAEAVAYLGYVGTLGPGEVDLPIALCDTSVKDPTTGLFSCNIGRMINSGNDATTYNTGAWVDFNQSEDCEGFPSANQTSIEPLIFDDDGECSFDGNPTALILGTDMVATNGNVATLFHDNSFYGCWKVASNKYCREYDEYGECLDKNPTLVPIDRDSDSDDLPDQPLEITLPVIECPDGEVGNCHKLVGAVTVNLIWVLSNNPDNKLGDAPTKMDLEKPAYDFDNGTAIYSDTWPNSANIKGTNESGITKQILEIPFNQPFTNGESWDAQDSDSLLTIMKTFPKYEQAADAINKRNGNDDSWQAMTLGELFYNDPTNPLTSTIKSDGYDGSVRWASLVKTFGLNNIDDDPTDDVEPPPAPYKAAGLYMKPSCEPHILVGNTGGDNFGMLAEKPVLVYHEFLHEIK